MPLSRCDGRQAAAEAREGARPRKGGAAGGASRGSAVPGLRAVSQPSAGHSLDRWLNAASTPSAEQHIQIGLAGFEVDSVDCPQQPATTGNSRESKDLGVGGTTLCMSGRYGVLCRSVGKVPEVSAIRLPCRRIYSALRYCRFGFEH